MKKTARKIRPTEDTRPPLRTVLAEAAARTQLQLQLQLGDAMRRDLARVRDHGRHGRTCGYPGGGAHTGAREGMTALVRALTQHENATAPVASKAKAA